MAGAGAAAAGAGGLRPLSLDVSPPSLLGIANDPATVPVGTADATATVTGGLGPFTYSWARVSGDVAIGTVAPTSAITSFNANCGPGVIYNAVWRCTVTDTATGFTAFDDVSVQIRNDGP